MTPGLHLEEVSRRVIFLFLLSSSPSVGIEEHAESRNLMKLVAGALPEAKTCGFPFCVAGVSANLKAYTKLLRDHIEKEDSILFPLADRLLTSEHQKAILVSFQKHETEEVGVGVHEEYLQLAHEIGQP